VLINDKNGLCTTATAPSAAVVRVKCSASERADFLLKHTSDEREDSKELVEVKEIGERMEEVEQMPAKYD